MVAKFPLASVPVTQTKVGDGFSVVVVVVVGSAAKTDVMTRTSMYATDWNFIW